MQLLSCFLSRNLCPCEWVSQLWLTAWFCVVNMLVKLDHWKAIHRWREGGTTCIKIMRTVLPQLIVCSQFTNIDQPNNNKKGKWGSLWRKIMGRWRRENRTNFLLPFLLSVLCVAEWLRLFNPMVSLSGMVGVGSPKVPLLQSDGHVNGRAPCYIWQQIASPMTPNSCKLRPPGSNSVVMHWQQAMLSQWQA